jgi:hypothetical protein
LRRASEQERESKSESKGQEKRERVRARKGGWRRERARGKHGGERREREKGSPDPHHIAGRVLRLCQRDVSGDPPPAAAAAAAQGGGGAVGGGVSAGVVASRAPALVADAAASAELHVFAPPLPGA